MANKRRDDFSKQTVEILAKRVTYCCSNPECRKATIGPNVNKNKTTSIGVAAHIKAAAPGGPRYDANMTSEERSDISNGIWLCQSCSKLIDADPDRYPIALLQEWKEIAEQTSQRAIESDGTFNVDSIFSVAVEDRLVDELEINKDTESTVLTRKMKDGEFDTISILNAKQAKMHALSVVKVLKTKDDFISFEDSAEKIENFCINNFGNEIYALYGMSMGGVLGAYLWQNKRLKIKNVILESSPLVSYNKFMTNILTRQYMMLTHKTKQRVEKIVNQATNSIIPEKKLPEFLEVMDNITDTTISNYINAIGKYKLPADIEMQGTKLFYFHGTKLNEMLAQKTAKYIKRNYPKSGIICFQGKGHCEDSLMHPEVMLAELDKILRMNS